MATKHRHHYRRVMCSGMTEQEGRVVRRKPLGWGHRACGRVSILLEPPSPPGEPGRLGVHPPFMTIRARLPMVHVIRGIMHWFDLRLVATAGKTPGDRSYGVGVVEGRGRPGRKPRQSARPSSRGFPPHSPVSIWILFWKLPRHAPGPVAGRPWSGSCGGGRTSRLADAACDTAALFGECFM